MVTAPKAGQRMLAGQALWILLLAGLLPSGDLGAGSRFRRAPVLELEDINPASATHGRKLALHELYAARGVVLQFTASWCATCREELPDLQEIQLTKDVPMVFVAADEGVAARDNIIIIAERSGLTAPVLFVPEAKVRQVSRDYPYKVLPATYFIDAKGRIRSTHQGKWTRDSFEKKLNLSLGF